MAGFARFNRRRAASAAAWSAGGVEKSQLDALVVDLGSAAEDVAELASLVVRKSSLDIVADAKVFAAVDTGYMRSSIGAEFDRDGLGSEVGPTAAYGGFVEHGTSTQEPQPFMQPAVDRRAPEFYGALEQIAGDIL